jgi:hypothetical protein
MALTAARTGVQMSPITAADVPRVARFLHANMSAGTSADQWARAIDVPWTVDSPNAGFMLVDGDRVVGAHLAFYSERTIDGRPERFCDLGAWCVLPEYRFHGLKLLKALLAQEGYHFTDLSPSGTVVAINARLGFRSLDTATALVANLPWPSWPRRRTIGSDPALLERTLTGRDLALYRDHAGAAAARHLVLVDGEEYCYVVLRKDRFKRLPFAASILHVSNPALFRRMAHPLARHLLLRHGALITLAEDRIVGERPRLSLRVAPLRQRMFHSPSLEPDQIDYFYSELVCLPW